ncbi:MAG: hypothetical protein AB3N18_08990 [Allomuricauda sp.]
MKYLALFVFVLFCNTTVACSCREVKLMDRFERADFVATAQIEKITPDSNKEYHNIEIKIGEIFKGTQTTKMKIESMLTSSCAFYTPVKSNWLIFAYENDNKELVFGSCSGAVQLDRKVNEERYPGITKKIERSNQRKLSLLRFIKQKGLNIKNEFRLNYTFLNNGLDQAKGFDLEEGSFALFNIEVSEKLKVKKVSIVKAFENESINEIITKCFKESFIFYNNDQSKIPKTTEITVGIFYYAAEGEHQSFVSTNAL